jgi:hypothetical protein
VKYDRETHEGKILLAYDQKRGIWANSLTTSLGRSIRTSGTIFSAASRHTLQVVGLAAALRSVTIKEAAILADKAGVPKPRLIITSTDATFLEALPALMKGDRTAKQLRAGKNFLGLLGRQLVRFQLDFVPLPEGDFIGDKLKNWAYRHYPDKGLMRTIPPFLVPSAVSKVD